MSLKENILKLKGPILVIGASGFVGANLLRLLLLHRDDVFGTASSLPNWRLQGIPGKHVITGNLLSEANMQKILDISKPATVFNCIAYGAYPFQNDIKLTYETNITFIVRLIEELYSRKIHCFINAGSSSEYGANSAAPLESEMVAADSHYAVTKAAAANLIYFYGKKKNMHAANLRLYAVYGEYEDSSRLIPAVVLNGLEGKLPEFGNPNNSRDFLYTQDACNAFICAAINLPEENYGESFNIGTGVKTTIAGLAALAKEIYAIDKEAIFTTPIAQQEVINWYANPAKAREILGWQAEVTLKEGLLKTTEWMKPHLEIYKSAESTKKVK